MESAEKATKKSKKHARSLRHMTKVEREMYYQKRKQKELKKVVQREKLITGLMTIIQKLIDDERRDRPEWIKAYRNEDARSSFYHQMLKRIGLPEKHARFAPWFYKSQKLQLNRESQALFDAIERKFIIDPPETEGEKAIKAFAKFLRELHSHENIHPRDINQAMMRRAFRDCAIKAPAIDFHKKTRRDATHPAFRQADPEDEIPKIKYGAAPPGLAPPVLGKTESHGRHVYFNYSGRWKAGHMRGVMGTYEFADGGKYTGAWKDSLQCGPGVAEYPTGVKYTGKWKDGKYDGFGTMEYDNGIKYEGEWVKGIRQGKGKLTFPTGASYQGDFFYGKRHGLGTAISAQGYKYVGEWKNGQINGSGYLTLPSGERVHRDAWGPCALGDAATQAKVQVRAKAQEERVHYTRLYRVRDDLRALDLHVKYRERKAEEDAEKERLRKEEMKRLRKEKKEAQEAAKDAFLKEMLNGKEIASSSEDDSDEDSDEDSDDDSDSYESEDDSEEDDDEDE